MAFTKIAAAGIGSTGTVLFQNLTVTGTIDAPSLSISNHGNVNAQTLNITGVSTFQASSYWGDGDVAYFGDGQDLLIFHNSTDSIIRDNGTGDLYIEGGNKIKLTNPTGIETYAVFNQDGASELWYDNVKRLETSGIGVSITNALTVGTGASISSPASNTLTLGTNNVERIRINSSGNIGIGTNNPSGATVDIFAGGTTSGFSLLRISNLADGASAGYLGLQKFGSSATSYGPYSANNVGIDAVYTQLNLGTQTGHPLTLYTGNVERARIDSSGNVGIGSTNPTSKLHVVGTSLFNVTSSTADGPFYIAGNKATTQGAIAHIRSDNVSGADDVFGGLKFSSSPGADFIFGKNSRLGTGYLQLRRENGTQLLTIDGSGNVGILSAYPASTLDVYGSFSVGKTNSPYRYCSISNVGQIVSNIANNGNESNLVLDNVGDLISTTNHGSNILFRTSDNSSVTAINSGQISVTKTQQWTSTASTRNSRLTIGLASGGTVSDRILISSAGNTAQILCYKRSSSASEDTPTANHQFLFLEPDGSAPGYYRRSIISEYKGFNQYSYWAIRYDGASYDYTGSLKCRITWSTSHASGAGFAEFSLAVRSGDSDGGPAPAGNAIQYGAVQYSNGWFYGWTVNPDFDVYYAGFNENKQFLVLRLNGYMSHNSGTYDGGVHETVDLESWGNAFQGLYRIGTSAPSGFTLNAVTKTILS